MVVRFNIPTLTVVALSCITLLFNSCQMSGFESIASLGQNSCTSKNMSYAPSSPFTYSKLNLGQAQGAQKISILTVGQKFVALANNNCMKSTGAQKLTNSFSMQQGFAKRAQSNFSYQAYSFSLGNEQTVAELEARLNSDNCIIGVSPNRTYRRLALPSYINDPLTGQQAHLNAIDGDNGYLLLYDAMGGLSRMSSVDDVVVAVLDSGVDYNHQDLSANMWSHPDGFGVDALTLGDLDPATNDYDPIDIDGHGTHVAGIVAAAGGNGVGGAGVMPFGAKIMAVRVFYIVVENGVALLTSDTTTIANGIIWSTMMGADVINLSLGTPGDDPVLRQTIEDVVTEGVFIAAAAGNADDNNPAQSLTDDGFTVYPAHYGHEINGMMAVGSVDTVGLVRSSFSHWGTTHVEISAPGAEQSQVGEIEGIYSTVPGNNYLDMPGTSMASPHIAAAAAIVKSWGRQVAQQEFTAAQIEQIITDSAVRVPALAAFFKDGKTLNLNTLALALRAQYPPSSAPGESSPPERTLASNCD